MNGSPQSEQVSSSTGWPSTGIRFTPIILSVAVLLSLGTADASRSQAVAASSSPGEAGFWGELTPTRSASRPSRSSRSSRTSTMHRHSSPHVERAPTPTQRQSLRTPPRVPRGSGGYVAPVLPRTETVGNPSVLQPAQPPPITTFSDRVNNAIQAYPLQKGIGNNPVNQQEFIRQRVNQP